MRLGWVLRMWLHCSWAHWFCCFFIKTKSVIILRKLSVSPTSELVLVGKFTFYTQWGQIQQIKMLDTVFSPKQSCLQMCTLGFGGFPFIVSFSSCWQMWKMDAFSTKSMHLELEYKEAAVMRLWDWNYNWEWSKNSLKGNKWAPSPAFYLFLDNMDLLQVISASEVWNWVGFNFSFLQPE